MEKVLFISSTGGHLKELFQLSPLFAEYDYRIITEKTKSNLVLKQTYPGKVNYMLFGGKEHPLSYMVKFPYNCLKSFLLFLRFRPQYVITTGSHTAVPMCYIAHFFRRKVIYIETYANIKTKSMAGKMVYPIADLFLVQWSSMLELYPDAIYVGGVF